MPWRRSASSSPSDTCEGRPMLASLFAVLWLAELTLQALLTRCSR